MSRIILRHSNEWNPRIMLILNRRQCSSSSDDEKGSKSIKKDPKLIKKPPTEAAGRLNALLQQIVQMDQQKSKLNLAQPTGRNAKTEPGLKASKTEAVEQNIITAAKDVANLIGGNTKKTESELLNKLINGQKDSLSQNLSDVFRGMKIERDAKPESRSSRAQQVKQLMKQQAGAQSQSQKPVKPYMKRQSTAQSQDMTPVDIFGAKPLGIFINTEFNDAEQTKSETWHKLHERELKLAVTHPPRNYFQEQILWTEQGKLWKFPIDNEQGIVHEANVYFADHVFLEEHLESWCPDKGPLRHFMELVCVGLSKNPYMSVQEKRDHIKWYENYFNEKRKLLTEVGAFPVDMPAAKQLE